jgi:hypothetical protein
MKTLPPDTTQLELAAEINSQLSSEAKVTFFRKQEEGEHGHIHYGMIFAYGTSRKATLSPHPFFDPDAIVKSITQWIAQLGQRERWSTTL